MNKKTMNRLTEVQIRKAKPREESFKMADGGGMYLLVHHTFLIKIIITKNYVST